MSQNWLSQNYRAERDEQVAIHEQKQTHTHTDWLSHTQGRRPGSEVHIPAAEVMSTSRVHESHLTAVPKDLGCCKIWD